MSFAALLIVVLLVYLFVPATSFSPEALSYSVAAETTGNGIGIDVLGPCERHAKNGWNCEAWSGGTSSLVIYRVQMEGSRCWHGHRTRPGRDMDGNPLPREVSGCLKIHDQIRIWDRVF